MLPGPPRARSRQDRHRPHGSAIGPCSQFSARARMRADVVLPQPRGPGEQVRVVDPVVGQRPLQRLGDVLLADHVGEDVGSVAPIERERGGCGGVRLGEQLLALGVRDRRVEKLRPASEAASRSRSGSGFCPRLCSRFRATSPT